MADAAAEANRVNYWHGEENSRALRWEFSRSWEQDWIKMPCYLESTRAGWRYPYTRGKRGSERKREIYN